MRVTERRGAVLAAAVLVMAGCGDTTGEAGGFRASVSLQPIFPADLADGTFELAVDRVRVRLFRPPAESLVDTVVFFPADKSQVSVRLQAPIHAMTERLAASLEFRAGTTLLFVGLDTVKVSASSTTRLAIPLQYVGPGASLTEVRIQPRDTALQLGDQFTFGVTASMLGDPVARFYVGWSTSDPVLAPVNAAGMLRAPGTRSHVYLRVVTPNGVKDSTRVSFSPPARTLTLVGGDGQTGLAGTQLSAPFEVRALAEDQLGVPGTRVEFRSLSGGQVRDNMVTTDDQGYARTFGILGPFSGPQAFEASVPGFPPISFLATAQTGPPARLLAFAGNAQVDTVGRLLKTPLVARVTDLPGNPIGNITVTWEVVNGGGSLGLGVTVTNLDGLASTDFVLGPEPGFQIVRAATTTPPAFVDFIAHALPGPGEALTVLSGDAQADTAGATLAPFAVAALDAFGNRAAGASVRWNQVQGGGLLTPTTSLSDANGVATTVYRLPTKTGTVHVIAEIVGKSTIAVFAAQVRPATPSALAVTAGDGQTGPVLTLLAPFEVRVADRFDNPVPGATVSWQVVQGGGTLSAPSTTADQNGIARVTYRLGASPGTNTVRARLPDGAEVIFTATATP